MHMIVRTRAQYSLAYQRDHVHPPRPDTPSPNILPPRGATRSDARRSQRQYISIAFALLRLTYAVTGTAVAIGTLGSSGFMELVTTSSAITSSAIGTGSAA